LADSKLDLLQGTLDVMVLQTLAALGPQHGYGIARRIEQVSGDQVLLNHGTIYASLVRLQQRGWIAAKWGTSDNTVVSCAFIFSQVEVTKNVSPR
jgi:PadR family transcriptional regulator, regulatory protein PadR